MKIMTRNKVVLFLAFAVFFISFVSADDSLEIEILTPINGSTIAADSVSFNVETNKDAICNYSLGSFGSYYGDEGGYGGGGASKPKEMELTDQQYHYKLIQNLKETINNETQKEYYKLNATCEDYDGNLNSSSTIFFVDFDDITLISNFSEHGIDTNGNGLYEYLVIEYEVNIPESGEYEIRERDLNNFYTYRKNYLSYLEKGTYKINITLSGNLIYFSQKNQTYEGFLSIENTFPYSKNYFFNYDTRNYNYTEFEPVYFSSYAVDMDGNGLYDYLTYNMSFDLGDDCKNCHIELENFEDISLRNDKWIEKEDNYILFNVSGMSLNKNYHPESPYPNKFNGSITFSELSIDGDGLYINFGGGYDYSDNYSLEEFENYSYLTGNFYDYGIDTNGNGLYDYLAIDMEANITRAGNYSVNGYLRAIKENGDHPRMGTGHSVYLEKGIQNVTLLFRGDMIYLGNYSENFFFEDAILEYSEVIGAPFGFTDYHNKEINLSSKYSYEDFEPYKGYLSPASSYLILEDINNYKFIDFDKKNIDEYWWKWAVDAYVDNKIHFAYYSNSSTIKVMVARIDNSSFLSSFLKNNEAYLEKIDYNGSLLYRANYFSGNFILWNSSNYVVAIWEDEIPYDLPKGWEWGRLGEIRYDWGQKIPDKPCRFA